MNEYTKWHIAEGRKLTGPNLARLEAKGLLALKTMDALPGQRGPARRYCRLTARGTQSLRHSTEMLTRMMDGVVLVPGQAKGT